MPAIVWVVLGLALLVAALLAVDWFTAGRAKRRILVRSKDQSATDPNVGYGAVMIQSDQIKMDGSGGL
jgi:hypothetical protein